MNNLFENKTIENFDKKIPENIYRLIGEDFSSQQLKKGMSHSFLASSKDIIYNSILNVYERDVEKTKSDIKNYNKPYDEKANEVCYNLMPKKDRVKVDLDVSYRVLPQAVNALETLKGHLKFVKKHTEKFNLLTQQEVQVLKLVCTGLSSKEVASELFIEPSTVSTHRKKINRKLEAKSCMDLYRYAVAFNLIAF